MIATRRGAPVILLAVLIACGTTGGSNATTSSQRNVLTVTEIAASGHTDAYTAVLSLRPEWLRPRGTTSLNQREFIKVYLDGSLMGGTDQLRQITTRSIASIRFLDALEATQRWGIDHGLGAIVVSTR